MNMSLYIGLVLTFCVLNNTYNLINLHPFQYIYFNSFFEKNANKLFEIDYWGVSNKHSLNLLLKNNPDKKKINIGVASFTNLWLSKKMLDKDLQKRLIIHGQNFNNSEFIFTNHFYGINPKSDNKFNIPKNYKKFSELRKGKILISEFYIKK